MASGLLKESTHIYHVRLSESQPRAILPFFLFHRESGKGYTHVVHHDVWIGGSGAHNYRTGHRSARLLSVLCGGPCVNASSLGGSRHIRIRMHLLQGGCGSMSLWFRRRGQRHVALLLSSGFHRSGKGLRSIQAGGSDRGANMVVGCRNMPWLLEVR